MYIRSTNLEREAEDNDHNERRQVKERMMMDELREVARDRMVGDGSS